MSKRTQFFLSHVLISFLIAFLIIGIVFFIWYPSPLATATGVINIFLILIAIDAIIGPLLGLMIYKERKKTLKFDLAVIILLQISALCYGVYSIAQGRPVWIAYYVNGFELIRNNEVIQENINKASPKFKHSSWLKPQYVGVEFANDPETRSNDLFSEVFGISLAQKPERYVDFSIVKPQMQQHARTLDELKQYNDPLVVKETLAEYPQATAFIPLKANSIDMTVLVNKEKGEVVKIVDLRPW